MLNACVVGPEEDGLVVRGPHPGDRRALLVQLTDEGQKVASEAFQQRVAIIGEMFRQGLRTRGVRT